MTSTRQKKLSESSAQHTDLIQRWLQKLSEHYNRALTAEQIETYTEGLDGLSPEAIEVGMKAALKDCRFFPTVADIRTHAPQAGARHGRGYLDADGARFIHLMGPAHIGCPRDGELGVISPDECARLTALYENRHRSAEDLRAWKQACRSAYEWCDAWVKPCTDTKLGLRCCVHCAERNARGEPMPDWLAKYTYEALLKRKLAAGY